MTNYTFKASDSSQFVNWDDPTVWQGGVVPNSADADVVFPPVTYASGGSYDSFVTIKSGETFLTHSINLAASEYLLINGTLNVETYFAAGGELDFTNGTLRVSSLEINGYDIQGSGQINANSVTNNTKITGNIDLKSDSFSNNGSLVAISGDQTITVTDGGFANISGSTLTGGSYEADATTYYGASTLSLDVGGVIATDNANITLGGGTVQSFDDASGQYVPLTSSLHTITHAGSLTIAGSQVYAFGSLADEGTLTVGVAPTDSSDGQSGSLSSSQLVVGTGGLVAGAGTIGGPISNQGVIRAGFGPIKQVNGAATLVLQGPVTGNGTLEVSAGTAFALPSNAYSYAASLELGGATSQSVTFDNNVGTLTLDAPSSFSGAIAPSSAGAGDVITLEGIALSSVTGETYSGNAASGILTLQEASGSLSLNFVGDYNVNSFTLSKGPQKLSTDPPSVDITVGAPVCFLAGTRIRIARNGVMVDKGVEQLEVGEYAVTSSGALRPICWLGHRTLDCRRQEHPKAVWPILIAAHAFGVGRPARDLFVSPAHALCVNMLEEILVPACALVNGTTIRQIKADRVTYWHVELDAHDILVAEGLPAESYLEMGNRSFFDGAIVTLAAGPDAPAHGHLDFCRPFHDRGPMVDAIRARLADCARQIEPRSGEAFGVRVRAGG